MFSRDVGNRSLSDVTSHPRRRKSSKYEYLTWEFDPFTTRASFHMVALWIIEWKSMITLLLGWTPYVIECCLCAGWTNTSIVPKVTCWQRGGCDFYSDDSSSNLGPSYHHREGLLLTFRYFSLTVFERVVANVIRKVDSNVVPSLNSTPQLHISWFLFLMARQP